MLAIIITKEISTDDTAIQKSTLNSEFFGMHYRLFDIVWITYIHTWSLQPFSQDYWPSFLYVWIDIVLNWKFLLLFLYIYSIRKVSVCLIAENNFTKSIRVGPFSEHTLLSTQSTQSDLAKQVDKMAIID